MTDGYYASEATLVSRTKKTKRRLWGCAAALLFLFLLGMAGVFFYARGTASAQSIVFIRSPQDGEFLPVGQPVRVSALARDEDKITRIELWVDDNLIDAQKSNTPGGINPFPLLSTWYPSEGAHTLIVRAFNSRGKSLQETIYVGALPRPDQDADGIADAADACPAQSGSGAAGGCPDRDFDGIPDSSDACPDEAGLPDSGCPAPSAADRDGDGLLDAADSCPDTVGAPLADGCPDADSDGVSDDADLCPAEPGAGADGCPAAPDVPPPDPLAGEDEAPPAAPPDEEPPRAEDDPEPDASGGFGGLFPPQYELFTPLEIEAYSLYIRQTYDSVWCYVQVGDGAPQRYDFAPQGTQMWDIAAEFAGANSLHILQPQSQALNLSLTCFGANEGAEPQAIEPLSATHPSAEWDGRALELRPAGENTIQVRYHICSPACSETVLQTPQLSPVTTGPRGNGPYQIRWRWNGNTSDISGFLFRRTVNNAADIIFVNDPAARTLDLADYQPACGETVELMLYAFRTTAEGRIFSRPSNTVSWHAAPCAYTARVTFTTLDLYNPPADEDGLHTPGPIYGDFWISNGTSTETISFNACWCYVGPGMTLWGTCDGLKLQRGEYTIQRDIFGWIERERASCLGYGCRSNAYFAPFNTTISIPLENGDDLTVGSRIMDCDARNADDVLYEEQESVSININALDSLTQALPRTLEGPYLNLNYFIRMGR